MRTRLLYRSLCVSCGCIGRSAAIGCGFGLVLTTLTGCMGGGGGGMNASGSQATKPVPGLNLNDGSGDRAADEMARNAEFLTDEIQWSDGGRGLAKNSSELPGTRPEDIAFLKGSEVQPGISNSLRKQNEKPAKPREVLASDIPLVLDPITRPDDTELTALNSDGTTATASAPPAEGKVNQLLVELTRELRMQAAYADSPMREHIAAASMAMLDPSRVIPPENLYDLTEREREIFAQFQTFFSELGVAIEAGPEDLNDMLLAKVQELREGLIDAPQLTVAEAMMCVRVKGFGDFTPFNANRFLAMSEQKAIVYLELDEFQSDVNTKGEWVTELSQELSIYAERDGLLVWNEPWQKVSDVSKRQRHDFFTVQVITFPRALTVGKYFLKIRVRDEHSGALAERSIPFEMVADPSLVSMPQ